MVDEVSLSHVVLSGWRAIYDPGTAEWLCDAVPVPRRLSLRQRFELVVDGGPPGYDESAFDFPDEVWDRQIELYDEGDRALKDNDHDAAVRSFTLLRESNREGDFPAALVEACLGLGDAARQIDDVDAAIDSYAQGVGLAVRCGYQYARVRGSIPLAYLHMRVGSTEQASTEFDKAFRTSREHGWRLDAANALTGLGEAFQRLRFPDKAVDRLKQALGLFEDLDSIEGIANATVQLGEIYRRERDIDEAARWYRRAVEAATRAGGVIALANALDGLAEVELAGGDLEAARGHHQQSYDVSGASYPRGRAHALNGLAQCAIAAYERAQPGSARIDDVRQAETLFHDAYDGYLAIDDLVSAATSQAGLARCAELLGDVRTALGHRVQAVSHIEEMRAQQLSHTSQDEYFRRFDRYYLDALATAVQAGELEPFVAVFEAVAGRRLANIVQASEPVDAGQAAALNTMMVDAQAKGWPASVTGESSHHTGESSRRERIERLSRLALRETVTDAAGQAFDDVMAAVYKPFDPGRAARLLADIDGGTSPILALAVLPSLPDLVWLWMDPDHPPRGGVHTMPPDTVDLVRRLNREGLRAYDTPADLAPLAGLLPDEAIGLVASQAVTIVPAGIAWGLPWPALPLPDGSLLGENLALAVCPSLTVLAHLRKTAEPYHRPETIVAWRSPAVAAHTLEAFSGTSTERVAILADADEARIAASRGLFDMVVIVAHGKPVRRLVHYLELDDHTFLTPGDVLAGRAPRQLVVISCWGANAPQSGFGDPLNIATLALVRGASSVVATTSELLDDAASNRFTSMVLAQAMDVPLPEAIRRATVRWLKTPGYRNGFLSRWAPLVAMGI